MTRLSSRAAWQAAVAASPMTASLRPMKATLLALGRLMSPDGTLERDRDEMVERTGVESRSLARHLKLAVDLGWLVRVRRGQKHVTAVYRAAMPDESHAAIRGVLSGGLSTTPGYVLRTGLSAPPCVLLNKDQSEPVGEGVAVDEEHVRRDDPIVGGAETTDQGGRADSRPRQGLPQPIAPAAGDVGRSTGWGPVRDIHHMRSAARGQPLGPAAATHFAITDVVASRGNHRSGGAA